MNRLRNKLILIFLAATVVPWGATLWITRSLFDLERSFRYRSTREMDALSRSLQKTGREYYQQAREDLKAAALAGRATAQRYSERDAAAWPEPLRSFWKSGEADRFVLEGGEGERLDYLVRQPGEALLYSRPLAIGMNRLSEQYRSARDLVYTEQSRDLPRGFLYTWVLLASFGVAWLAGDSGVAGAPSEPPHPATDGWTFRAGRRQLLGAAQEPAGR